MKPSVLKPGDTIGIVSPSWGGASLYPRRVQRGKEYLESLGFEVIIAEHAAGRRGYLSGTPEERVSDLHRMFGDPKVKAIIATIGGNHSCHLLPLLDFELIRKNPKIFMGFSDITVLNLAIYSRTGLVVFNGPTLMTDLAEYPRPLAYTREYLLKALTRPEPVGTVAPAQAWTDEFIDWGSGLHPAGIGPGRDGAQGGLWEAAWNRWNISEGRPTGRISRVRYSFSKRRRRSRVRLTLTPF